MASEEATLDLTISGTIASLLESYRRMGIPIQRYLFGILLPAFVFFLATLGVALLVNLPLGIKLPFPLLGLLLLGAAVFYPRVQLSQRKQALNDRFHLMVTHMTVLSTTKIDRMEVFRALASEDEYGELATEMGRVVELVDTWNLSLDDACRRRAKEVPSDALADFFDRLAYTMGAGQSLEDYLLSEQDMIIENYKTIYEGTLGNLEVMKDLYLSMILSMTFALVFAVVLPILTGTNPMMTVSAVIVLFIFVQTGFFVAIRSLAPYDPVWYHPEEITSPMERRLNVSFAAGVVLTLVFGFISFGGFAGISPITLDMIFFFWDPVPLSIYAVFPITPLLIPGLIIRQEEKKIKARDQEYPSFIRALGSTEGAKQSTTGAVLESLREKEFGPLSENIDNLYKRLNMRIEPEKAWRHFTAESRSYLIQTFSEMYLIGRKMGGSPKQLGELISENMNEVLQLRQQRDQETTTLIGVLYGISAAATFAFFIGLQVVNILSEMSLNLQTGSSNFEVSTLIHTSVYEIPIIEFLLITVIIFNALLSSLMIRTTDGGHKLNSYMHFVVLSWIGALVAIFTKLVVSSVISI
ncbi:type II secretion system protein [Halorhabdus utahensis DSM 12940]|uniref:Type II secretion system protein n=1 Tax=Halorhabdus utahensis (strain DSM 12940 / JCM 11049 / AX-2) TaxID=519442 RepID=C7NUY1_HALUD|nr:archaellar assembly protein FlaJ [Halorhabdus utahensis]ACV11144.1 type II secretion system protein [Halorhabdus utahensis DSM 12940]